MSKRTQEGDAQAILIVGKPKISQINNEPIQLANNGIKCIAHHG